MNTNGLIIICWFLSKKLSHCALTRLVGPREANSVLCSVALFRHAVTVRNYLQPSMSFIRGPKLAELSAWCLYCGTFNKIFDLIALLNFCVGSLDLGYVHIDTSASPGLRLRVVRHSYKLHPHEWSVRGHLYKHITQRVSVDNLQWNRMEWMLCEISNNILPRR